jgi:hypothetical protein
MLVLVFGLCLGFSSTAEAAFPGANGRIAYVSGGDLYTARYDGTDRVLLATGVSGPRTTGPRWSPDGTKIVFSRNPGIWIINADGTNQHQIRATGLYPAWSPDGTKIVFAEGVPIGPPHGNKDRLHVMNADGTSVVRLPTESAAQNGDGSLISPTWSPDGQSVAYVEVSSMGNALFLVQANGTGRTELFPFDICVCLHAPEWLPDGSRIAYSRWFTSVNEQHLVTVRPDGTDEVDLGTGFDVLTAWSPDGTSFASGGGIYAADGSFLRSAVGRIHSWQPILSNAPNLAVRINGGPNPAYRGEIVEYPIRVSHVSGSQTATDAVLSGSVPDRLEPLSATTTHGTCSIAGQAVSCVLGDMAPGDAATITVRAQVRQTASPGPITSTATVAASQTDPDPLNNSASVTTDVVVAIGYPRPSSAPSLAASLVPAYLQCNSPNRTHGPPLEHPSCSPPTRASSYLTVGTAESNARATQSIASERVKVVPGNPQTSVDEADVRFSVSATDIRRASNLGDYTGQLQVVHTLRLTDRRNAGNFTVDVPGTMRDYDLKFPVPCTATASTSIGSTCAVTTTADALAPGTVLEGKRSLWDLGHVRVFDGGSDGVASTDDNTLFLTQGVFVP